jgi:hypothetical protein
MSIVCHLLLASMSDRCKSIFALQNKVIIIIHSFIKNFEYNPLNNTKGY